MGLPWILGCGPWKALSEQALFAAQERMYQAELQLSADHISCHSWKRNCLGWF